MENEINLLLILVPRRLSSLSSSLVQLHEVVFVRVGELQL